MTVLDFINRLLGREKPSGTMARERLQLVLAHDRSDLNPELLEQMRREILAVVQRYVEIDIESCDVSLETEDRVTALLANLPIKRTREFPLPPDHDQPGVRGGEGKNVASDPAPRDHADGAEIAGNDEATLETEGPASPQNPEKPQQVMPQ
jgi:cell division topological specificity factor